MGEGEGAAKGGEGTGPDWQAAPTDVDQVAASLLDTVLLEAWRALGFLGLLSVAVGFAFRDIFENFFAGILLWRFPFEPGGFIECQGIAGRVEEVTIRMTRIRKTTGEPALVPNSVLFENPIDMLTDLPRRRVTVMTGVAYDEDVPEAVLVIENAVKECDSVLGDEPVQVFPQAFGASSIDIEATRSRGEVVTA